MQEIIKTFFHLFIPRVEPDDQLTLLLLHATGGTESDLLLLGRTLSPHAALLSPRGKVLENGMARFFRRLAEGVFDVEDLHYRTHELANFTEAAAKTYHFDIERLIAVGYSNGANMAAALLLVHPRLFKAAILFRPMVPFTPDPLPDLKGKSVLIAAGRKDPLIRAHITDRLANILQLSGAKVTVKWHENGHELSNEEILEARDWLKLWSRKSVEFY